jgi:hypothetical protein
MEVHQKAFKFWWDVLQAIPHQEDTDHLVAAAHEFYLENNLYLDGKSRKEFRKMLSTAGLLCRPISALLSSEERENIVKQNRQVSTEIRSVGRLLAEGIGLPHLKEDDIEIQTNSGT